jgi:hypothetical protein
MKRILFLGAIIVVGTAAILGLVMAYLTMFPNGALSVAVTGQAPAPVVGPPPDGDALAHRMLADQDVYIHLRDETLAAYAKAHPGSHPFDMEARETLKLAAYLWVWDDYYGEGLWRILNQHCERLQARCPDQIWLSLEDVVWGPDEHSSTDAAVNETNACENRLGATDYPAAFKFASYTMAMSNMIKAGEYEKNVKTSLAALPDITTKTVGAYRALIAQHLPPDLLYRKGRELINEAKDDDATLVLVSRQLDQSFGQTDPTNAVAEVLDALCFLDHGWHARGGDYANKVTEEGWKIFGDSLHRAGEIELIVYARTPHEPGVAKGMMDVVQGLQLPRDQMELWFKRGLEADPNDYRLYQAKEYYLLPRWYGTEEDEWAFALSCVQGGNWAAKIPLVMVDELTYREQNDAQVYTHPEIWQPLESVFREFLWRYPASVHYRSLFALDAAKGEHWDVAKEQFKILGDDWDPDVFPDTLYADTMKQVNSH